MSLARCRSLGMALAMTALTLPAGAADLQALGVDLPRWQQRVLLIWESGQVLRPEELASNFARASCGLEARRLLVIHGVGTNPPVLLAGAAPALDPGLGKRLANEAHARGTPEGLALLFGLDGEEKWARAYTAEAGALLEEVFREIDGMPMRQAELARGEDDCRTSGMEAADCGPGSGASPMTYARPLHRLSAAPQRTPASTAGISRGRPKQSRPPAPGNAGHPAPPGNGRPVPDRRRGERRSKVPPAAARRPVRIDPGQNPSP